MSTPILACKGCGATKPEPDTTPTDLFPSEHCGECPPWTCGDCGEQCSAAALCSCWIRFNGMALADIKAVFAADGFFSLGGLGTTGGE
ncbi:hypothetical protein [Streptomyces sp. NPDC008092]|uniref:hypothetical protein n=1 Tax=Streptomyces sp. NPDC008092 TaxID=3364808 RepID=UPI0036E774FE